MGKGARNRLGMAAAAAGLALLSGCLEETTLYVGGEGNIRWYRLDENAGTLEPRGGLDYPHAATFFASSADGRHLYALLRTTNEAARIAEGLPLEGFVVSYAIDRRTGALTETARRSSEGDRPTYVTLDKTGKFALVA